MKSAAQRFWVPVVALLVALGSGIWMMTQTDRPGPWNPTGGPMVAGHTGWRWLAGDGEPVDGLAEARERAEEYAATLDPDLRVGEVMRFTENYYAELEQRDGTKATEILVDPSTGAVQLEFGPAMMWNTRYGMMSRPPTVNRLSAEQAQRIAQRWADDHGGLAVADAGAFPGYHTLHTLEGDRIQGMVSVHADTGEVWFHSWHGEFEEMSEGG